MKKHQLKKLALLLLTLSMFVFVSAQDCGPIDRPKLKELLTGLGFEVKTTTNTDKTENYEITNKSTSLNVPTKYEISPSTNYIWITINLGTASRDTVTVYSKLIKQNANIQPAFFYVTQKGNLMIGMPIENRAVTAAVLRRCNDFIVKRVEDTKADWQSQ